MEVSGEWGGRGKREPAKTMNTIQNGASRIRAGQGVKPSQYERALKVLCSREKTPSVPVETK